MREAHAKVHMEGTIRTATWGIRGAESLVSHIKIVSKLDHQSNSVEGGNSKRLRQSMGALEVRLNVFCTMLCLGMAPIYSYV